MKKSTIVEALITLGFSDGWVANEADGIVLWERSEPQPTDKQLKTAGWIPADAPEEGNPE